MKIKKIRILGFKSLEDVVFEPETGFSCLVGSNGAGKSNFCDALMFFKKIILEGIESTLDDFTNVLLINSSSDKVEIHAHINSENTCYEYNIIIDLMTKKIIKEYIRIDKTLIYQRTENQSKKLDFSKLREFTKKINEDLVILGTLLKSIDDAEINNIDSDEVAAVKEKIITSPNYYPALSESDVPESLREPSEDHSLSNDKTALSSYYDTTELFEFFSQLTTFRINPLAPKLPNKLFNKSNLLMHGDNLATILSELKKDEDKWQTLHEWLGLIVPSISEVEVKQGEFDSSLSLHFNENGKLIPAISISDGTIYTLSILAAILWNQDKNTLMIIEEPERGIHPQALSELINFMREAAQQNLNIITTTHSETFVRNCKLEELWLVDKIAGKTQIKSAKQQNPHLKEASLDQAWLMNLFNGGLPW